MASAARAYLESLLSARKLDRTLTYSWQPKSLDDRSIAPTGIQALDDKLGGGIPRGELSEFIGPRSAGTTSVALAALAAATGRGEVAAFVDPLDMLDPETAAREGIDLSRLLWVRGQPLTIARSSLPRELGELRRPIDRALKALNLVLQAGGFGMVVLDLNELPPQIIGRIPFTTWMRLQRVIEGSQTACVLLGSDRIARSSAGLTVMLQSVPCKSKEAREGLPPNKEAREGLPGNKEAREGLPGSKDTAGAGRPSHVRLFPERALEAHVVRSRQRWGLEESGIKFGDGG